MDWKNTIAEIQRLGQLTQAQIAEMAGCGQATVSDLANGSTKQPNYALGCALMKILKGLRIKPTRKQKADPAPAVNSSQSTALDLEKSDQERRDQERRDAERREAQRRGATESASGV